MTAGNFPSSVLNIVLRQESIADTFPWVTPQPVPFAPWHASAVWGAQPARDLGIRPASGLIRVLAGSIGEQPLVSFSHSRSRPLVN